MLRNKSFFLFLFFLPIPLILFFPFYAIPVVFLISAYLFFSDRKRFYVFLILGILLFFVSLLRFNLQKQKEKFEGKVVHSEYALVLSQKNSSYQSVLRVLVPVLKTGRGKKIVFFGIVSLKINGLNNDLTGCFIKFKGIFSKEKVYRNKFCTNYYKLLSSGNLYFVKIKDSIFVEKRGKFNLLNIDKTLLKSFDDYRVKQFLAALVFGRKDALNYSFSEKVKKLGIYHLFVLSGFHFGIFYLIFKFLLFPLPLRKRYKDFLILLILSLILLITSFSSPSVRVYLMLAIYLLFSINGIKIPPVDAVGLAGVLMLFFNPFNALNVGFLMSFILSGGIVLFLENKGFLMSYFSVPFLAFCLLIPFYLFFFNYIPLISPLVNLFLIPLIVILFWLFFLNALTFGLLSEAVSFLSLSIIRFIDFIPSFSLKIYPNPFVVFLAVVVSFSFFFAKSKKYVFLAVFFVILIAVAFPSAEKRNFISFLDAKKSRPIIASYNGQSALIGTGDAYFSAVCLPKEVNFYGIKKIDFFIIPRLNSRVLNRIEDVCSKFEVSKIIVKKREEAGVNLFRLKWIANFFKVKLIFLDKNEIFKAGDFFIKFEKNGLFFKAGKTSVCFNHVGEKNCDFCVLKKRKQNLNFNSSCVLIFEKDKKSGELFFPLKN